METVSIPYGTIKRSIEQPSIDLQVVSIPYGTIKRAYGRLSERSHTVSIPYGTIKSPASWRTGALSSTFQFHMVRLKDRLCLEVRERVGFQFHMVRLKALLDIAALTGKSSFNSIWYD